MDNAAIRSHYESHDFARPHPPIELRSPSPTLVAEANARVSHWMRTVRRSRNWFKEKMSRSVDNLTDLTEEDEEEAARRWGCTKYLFFKFSKKFALFIYPTTEVNFNPCLTTEVGWRC